MPISTNNANWPHTTISMVIQVATATAQDISQLEWGGEFRHFRNLFRRSYEEQLAGRRLLLVARAQNTAIGRLFVQYINRNPRIADGITRGYLYSFQVFSVFRGLGIGTLLLNTAEERLRQRGYLSVTIAVAKDNNRAQHMYEHHGYTIFDDDPGDWQYTDHRGRLRFVSEPCWLMEKQLLNDSNT